MARRGNNPIMDGRVSEMKIKLSQSDWKRIGVQSGWIKGASGAPGAFGMGGPWSSSPSAGPAGDPEQSEESPYDKSDIVLSNLWDMIQSTEDPVKKRELFEHYMDAYNHHMVGEYDQAIERANRAFTQKDTQ